MQKTVPIFVCLVLMTAACCFADSKMVNTLPQSGSYEFNNISLADALRLIDRDADIVIDAPFDELRETVQKSYENVSIDKIIRDLMQRQNYAIIWHYNDRKIVAVDIRIEDEAEQSVSGTASRKESLSRSTPGSRARSNHVRRYNPTAGNRLKIPPAPDPERYPGVQPPPMPPGM